MTKDPILTAILLMAGFCITAPIIDVFAKLAADTIPVGQITTARFIGQVATMAPICMWLGHSLRMPQGTLGIVSLRAVFLILSTYLFVAALQYMPIADALAIVFVEPFILLILGKYLFGDEVGPRRIAACAVGFIGVLFVIQPKFAAFGLIVLYPLGTAVSFALYMLVTRTLGRRMHPIAMQLHTAVVAAAMCVPVLLIANESGLSQLDSVMPQGIEWVWLVGVGVAAAFSHLLMTYALRLAPTTTLAPLHYFEIVSAVFFGYLVFQDFPDAMTWAGIGIVVASGLYIIHRERITSRAIAHPVGHP